MYFELMRLHLKSAKLPCSASSLPIHIPYVNRSSVPLKTVGWSNKGHQRCSSADSVELYKATVFRKLHLEFQPLFIAEI